MSAVNTVTKAELFAALTLGCNACIRLCMKYILLKHFAVLLTMMGYHYFCHTFTSLSYDNIVCFFLLACASCV